MSMMNKKMVVGKKEITPKMMVLSKILENALPFLKKGEGPGDTVRNTYSHAWTDNSTGERLSVSIENVNDTSVYNYETKTWSKKKK
jgi:hypothetical protein